MTAQQIISTYLEREGIPSRWVLGAPLVKRPYCVQYDETDYAFIRRICAAEGIFFFFEDPGTDLDLTTGLRRDARVVFADRAEAYPTIAGKAEFLHRPIAAAGSAMTELENAVTVFRRRETQRPTRVLFRRYLFERPQFPPVESASEAAELAGLHTREEMAGFVDDDLTIYEHQQSRESAALAPVAARVALEAERTRAVEAVGRTYSRRLAPGHRFKLAEHELPELDGGYVVSSIRHTGVSPDSTQDGDRVYEARFTGAPASVALRPRRPASRSLRQTLETATVVGPPGEEIHTDDLGRVKVQFHWDLHGKFDEHASAWLRVAQAWAGPHYGAQFLPRVGNEVIVGYMDGDTDRPVVLASLHNVAAPPPFGYPSERTKSGIVTSRTPGGAGANALVFDDRAGFELAALRGNRTLEMTAVDNASLTAGGGMSLNAGGDLEQRIGGDRTLTISGSDTRRISADRNSDVGASDTLKVSGPRSVHVAGPEEREILGIARHVYGSARVTVVGDAPNVAADDQLGVSGQYRVGSARAMRLTSLESILLECGASKIFLTPNHITIESPSIKLQATDEIDLVQGDPGAATLTLKGSASLGGGTVAVVAGGKPGSPPARLFLDTKAHLDGDQVLLNCGPMGAAGGTPDAISEETGIVTFTFESGEKLPPGTTSVTLVIATPTGKIVERECPVGGSVEMTGRIGETFTVVEARVGDKRIDIHALPVRAGGS